MIVVNGIIVIDNLIRVVKTLVLCAVRWSHCGLSVHVNVVDIFHRLKHMSGVVVVVVEQRLLLQSVAVGLWQHVGSVHGGRLRRVFGLGRVLSTSHNADHTKNKASSNARC
jgi:hypothetical protein